MKGAGTRSWTSPRRSGPNNRAAHEHQTVIIGDIYGMLLMQIGVFVSFLKKVSVCLCSVQVCSTCLNIKVNATLHLIRSKKTDKVSLFTTLFYIYISF